MTEKENSRPAPLKGFARICSACRNSLAGLRYAVTREAAFQQEMVLFILLIPLLIILPLSLHFKALLFAANCLVLIVELLNTALEDIVDLASPDYHKLAGRAKDLASAAVLISLLAAATLWTIAIASLVR